MGGIISSVGTMFGGGKNNANFDAKAAPLIQPVTQGQVNQGISNANQGLSYEDQLINALSSQGGIQNQNQVFGEGQDLFNQYKNLANGVGPNPAQAQFAQNTGNNIAGQAALMAGQRGGGANVGLLARQIGQQGGAIQQQEAGQEATLQAQQELAAMGAEQAALNQLGSTANNQVANQIGATGNYNQYALGNQNNLLSALGGYNSAQVGNTSSQNSANAGIASTNANNMTKTLGGLINSGGQAAAIFGAAEGGEIPDEKRILSEALSKRQFPNHLRAMAEIYHPKVLQKMACGGMAKGAVVPGEPKFPGKNTTKQDVVPAMLTPKEIVLPLSVTQSKNPGEAAKAFVEKIKGKDGDFKEALRAHIKNRKSK